MRMATLKDVEYLAPRLRFEDKQEILRQLVESEREINQKLLEGKDEALKLLLIAPWNANYLLIFSTYRLLLPL